MRKILQYKKEQNKSEVERENDNKKEENDSVNSFF